MDPQAVEDRFSGIWYLRRRIRPVPVPIAIALLGILVPLINESSNQKKKPAHTATILLAYSNLFFWCLLSVLAYKLSPSPSNPRRVGYAAIKLCLHLCVLSLVTLCFSLSVMMRMNKAVTVPTLVAASALVFHRARRCAATGLDTDLAAYRCREEVIHHLVELSTMATTTALGALFSSEEGHGGAWLLGYSQYLAFFVSVAASLTMVKSVARRREQQQQQPLWEMVVLMCVLYAGLVALALAIGASRAGRFRWWAPLALVPEAVALAVWFVLWVKHKLRNYWGGGRAHKGRRRHQPQAPDGEEEQQPPHEAVVVGTFAVVTTLVSYNARTSSAWALYTLYDEAFVISITGAGAAVLGWRMLITQPATRAQPPGVRAAAKTLAWSAICLVGLSLLLLFGIIVRLLRGETTRYPIW